jgi:hypothetical protein
MIHANAAGLIGGFAVCGHQTGLVTTIDTAVTCRRCLDRMFPPIRWDECPSCRAGVKHIHCRHPWQDEGGGG